MGLREGADSTGGCQNSPPVTPVITFAHRGASAARPENTLAAFQLALEQGARGLESDAWLSADGEVVLVHDQTFRRGVTLVRVGRTPADRLARFDVPRLADLYDRLGTGFELSIDVQEAAAADPLVEVAVNAGPDAPGRLWLCSPDLSLLRDLRPRIPPTVRLVHSRWRRHLTQPLERHAADLADAGIQVMNMHHSEWTAGLVALFHRFDVQAFAWDTQEVRHLRKALDMGIDAVYSDHVDRMVATVGEWSGI